MSEIKSGIDAERYRAEKNGLIVFGGFEGSSLDGVEAVGDDAFVVQCLEEPGVPEICFNRVFYDYSFTCGIRNETSQERSLTIRLNLCERSGRRNLHFMEGPYWVREGNSWRTLPPSVHESGEYWINTRLTVAPHQEIVLSSKPFWTPKELLRVIGEYEEHLPFVSHRSIGTTAEGRDILCVETEERDKVVMITSSLQSAEFAGSTILSWLDWLSMNSNQTQAILDQFQFCLIPETMSDGLAHGYSIMNGIGQCPMFEYRKAFDGDETAAAETAASVRLLKEKQPVVWVDLHIHPGRYNTPKLAWVRPEYFLNDESAARTQRVQENIMKLCPEWRPVMFPLLDRPDFMMRDHGHVLAAENVGTTGLVFQSYALTEEGKKAMFAKFMESALAPLMI